MIKLLLLNSTSDPEAGGLLQSPAHTDVALSQTSSLSRYIPPPPLPPPDTSHELVIKPNRRNSKDWLQMQPQD